jgi:hypothetical protein
LTQIKPVVVTFYNQSWTCTCKVKTKIGTYAGKFCWHEEWIILKVAKAMQAEILAYEKMYMAPESGTTESPASTPDPPREDEVTIMSTIHVLIEDEQAETMQQIRYIS